MHGQSKNPTWVRLASEPRLGQTTLQLEQPVSGWTVGDRLILPDTRQIDYNLAVQDKVYERLEELTIGSIAGDGKTITIDKSTAVDGKVTSTIQFDHLGARDPGSTTPTVLPDGTRLLPHVGNLSRNVVLRSEDPAGTRAHGFLTHRANVDIRYTELQDMGRTNWGNLNNTQFDATGAVKQIGTNQIGRYPLHLHHLMGPAETPGSGE